MIYSANIIENQKEFFLVKDITKIAFINKDKRAQRNEYTFLIGNAKWKGKVMVKKVMPYSLGNLTVSRQF